MSYGMYIIGAVIFGAYMCFTFWNIIYSNQKQEEENNATISHDSKDLDE